MHQKIKSFHIGACADVHPTTVALPAGGKDEGALCRRVRRAPSLTTIVKLSSLFNHQAINQAVYPISRRFFKSSCGIEGTPANLRCRRTRNYHRLKKHLALMILSFFKNYLKKTAHHHNLI